MAFLSLVRELLSKPNEETVSDKFLKSTTTTTTTTTKEPKRKYISNQEIKVFSVLDLFEVHSLKPKQVRKKLIGH